MAVALTAAALALVGLPAGAAHAADCAGNPLPGGGSAQAQAAVGYACQDVVAAVPFVAGGGHAATPGPTGGGLDSAGFVRWEYYRGAGYDLGNGAPVDLWNNVPAAARLSASQGTGPLQPGDLLFFSPTGPTGIHQVALYLGSGYLAEEYDSTTNARVTQLAMRDYFGAIRPQFPVAPSVSAPSGMLSGTVTLNASAPGASSVSYLVDGTAVGTSSASGFPLSWDTTKVSSGYHQLTATASNALGTSPASTPLAVTVGNGPAIAMAPSSAALLASDSQQDFFGRGPDGHLHHWFWTLATGVVNQDWGGSLAGTPVSFVSTGGQQNVFGRGSDGSLYHWWWNSSMNTPQAETWPGAVTGDPAASFNSAAGQYDVYAQISNGTLQHWWWTPGMVGPASNNWGGSLVGTPVALFTGNQQVVFARNANGTLSHWWWNAGMGDPGNDTWSSGTGTVAGDPSATFTAAAGEFDVYAQVSDGTLQHWWWMPGMNGPASNNWGGNVSGRPTAVFSGSQQVVFARNASGTLQHWWSDAGTNIASTDTWSAGTSLTGEPAASYRTANGQFDVYGRLADGTVQHWWWAPGMAGQGTNSWGGTLA